MRPTLAAAIVLCVAPLVLAEPELKGTPGELTNYLAQQAGQVGLVGTGEVKAMADRAVVRLRVTTSDASLANALDANRKIRNDIVTKLKAKGIDTANISTSSFSWVPRQSFMSKKTASYEVSNLVSVVTTTEQQFQDAAAELDNHKEAQFEGVSVENSNADKLKLAAIDKACDEVKNRKAAYEKALGINLVPITFSDQGVPTTQPHRFHEAPASLGPSSSFGFSSAPARIEAAESGLGSELTYTVVLQVMYQVKH